MRERRAFHAANLMISTRSRTKEWIIGIRKEAVGRDPILIEKMILALTLVENLRLSNLDFIFKGGTSLTLLLGKPKRFSIDIDIILAGKQNLDSFFRSVIDQGAFYRYEENIREGDLPKQHYKFFFHSVIQDKESHILLDILFDKNPYPRLQEIDVNAPILSMEGRITRVSCAVAECLLGDKLTAFAPNTTGIQYGMSKEIEIAKQLFDIGTLFDVASDVDLIHATFEGIATKELVYRGMSNLVPADVLLDSFRTACLIGTRGTVLNREHSELLDGIKKLAAFVYSGNFTIDNAIVCASKVAYLVGLILKQKKHIARFQTNIDISSWNISDPDYSKLNKLKKTSPEAFFYFYQALELLTLSAGN
jgi:hypothetical protein